METPYLRSWKEIATYLKTSVRTVQRYEKIGLPIHRIAPMKVGGVFALRHEIDAWLLSRFQPIPHRDRAETQALAAKVA
jgi:hypothetical protein